MNEHIQFLRTVEAYVRQHPEAGAYVSDFVARGTKASRKDLEKATDMEDALRILRADPERARQIAIDAGIITSDTHQLTKTYEDVLCAKDKEINHWKSNHANVVDRLKVAASRPDLPSDRLPLFEDLKAQIERLQTIIDSRPAINQGLPDTYIKWSQSIYAMEYAHARETPQ